VAQDMLLQLESLIDRLLAERSELLEKNRGLAAERDRLLDDRSRIDSELDKLLGKLNALGGDCQ
jgi:hypothetical protein